MGLGGYLAARSEADHYATERRREGKKKKHKWFYGIGIDKLLRL